MLDSARLKQLAIVFTTVGFEETKDGGLWLEKVPTLELPGSESGWSRSILAWTDPRTRR